VANKILLVRLTTDDISKQHRQLFLELSTNKHVKATPHGQFLETVNCRLKLT